MYKEYKRLASGKKKFVKIIIILQLEHSLANVGRRSAVPATGVSYKSALSITLNARKL